jgi:hypothetical protein
VRAKPARPEVGAASGASGEPSLEETRVALTAVAAVLERELG